MSSFKKDFAWGVATASYQIEGAYDTDGKGENIWDVACRTPNCVFENNTGNIACDHYHRFREDVALIKGLGVNSYRFSLNWSRIFPQGIGKINQKGLDFYKNLVDELLKNGIEPYITLFHWDYPSALYNKGGWLNDDSSLWFEEYAASVAETFKGKVKNYFTINEPQCIVGCGHSEKSHAPFLNLSNEYCLQVVHNILKANGRAMRILKKIGGEDVKVGMAQCSAVMIPQENTPESVERARKFMFGCMGKHFFQNGLFQDPIFFGEYPSDIMDELGARPKIKSGDMEIIKCENDFLGLNIYYGESVDADKNGNVHKVEPKAGTARTTMGWTVTPQCLYWGPKFFYERYKRPVIISENGVALSEWKTEDGKIDDSMRCDYLTAHLRELERCAQEGCDIDGYFYWSFMDNFEWTLGYAKRFGLVHVDFDTLERTPKQSYYHYKDILKKHLYNK